MKTKRATKRYTAGEIRSVLSGFGLVEDANSNAIARTWLPSREPAEGLDEVLGLGWSPTFYRIDPRGCADDATPQMYGIGQGEG